METATGDSTATNDEISTMIRLENLIAEKKYKELLDMFTNMKPSTLNAEAWEIVPKLCSLMTPSTKVKLLHTCKDILIHVSSTCDPKDLLLVLVEQLNDRKDDDVLFLGLLPPIQNCIERITRPRGHSLALALDALYGHIATLPLPAEQNLEGEERFLLELDENVQRILKTVEPFMNILANLTTEYVQTRKSLKSDNQKEGRELMKCLIKLLGQPLAYLELMYDRSSSRPRSRSREIAETCIKSLSQLQPDFVKSIVNIQESNSRIRRKNSSEKTEDEAFGDNEIIPELGYSTMVYLAFGEHLELDKFPQAYSHLYLFEVNCFCMVFLLQKSESFVVRKGISLCSSLLVNLKPRSMPAEFLEWNVMNELLKSVIYVAASAKISEIRQSALQITATLVKAFDSHGRNKLLRFMLTKSPRQGVIGYVITLLKDEISENLDKHDGKDLSFAGAELEKLLMLVFSLPSGEKSDLLENTERIMGALNLLRFLVLTDTCEKNVTGIWNLIPLIEQNYFRALGAGINLSRSHYQLELNKLQENKSKESDALTSEVSLTRHQQLRIFETAIHTFDMMEAILGKVSSLVKQGRVDHNS